MNDFKQFRDQRLAQAALECEKQLNAANTQLMQARQKQAALRRPRAHHQNLQQQDAPALVIAGQWHADPMLCLRWLMT